MKKTVIHRISVLVIIILSQSDWLLASIDRANHPVQTGSPQQISPKNLDELKAALRERYNSKVLLAVVSGLSAGEYKKELFGRGDASLFWHHFHSSIKVPNRVASGLNFMGRKVTDMDQLDERTFGDLDKGFNVSPIQKGEPLKVYKFYVTSDAVEFHLTPTRVGHNRDMDINKASMETTTTIRDDRIQQKVTMGRFGLGFSFYFDKNSILKAGNYDAIVTEINKYLLPKDEAEKAIADERNIQVDVGMDETEILKKTGQPIKTIQVGNQKFLKYSEMTVIIKDGKVAEVKVN